MDNSIIIKPGREKPIRNRHPWIFSGAIQRVVGDPQPGDIVTVRSQDGKFLARGYWNPRSQIQVRILTWVDAPIDDDWWRRMLRRAADGRRLSRGHGRQPAACRVVNAENDYLPGLIVDRYADWLVVQALTLGIDRRKALIAELLGELLKPAGIYERSDVDVRGKEGLPPVTGALWGEAPPQHIEIHDGAPKLYVNVHTGHKTGYYLDQCRNRQIFYDVLTGHFEGHCRLLNVFSYSGGFGLQALCAGHVHVINVDSSREALEMAAANMQLNGFDRAAHGESYELVQADAFGYLRDRADQGAQFDVVVLDPPKFAHSQRQVEGAARGYKDLNLHAFKVVRPGGHLLTFSCSGAVSADLFQKIVFGALADSGREAQILQHLGPGDDHPVALTFPEGAYLKGLLLRVW